MDKQLPKSWIFIFLAIGGLIVVILLTGPQEPVGVSGDVSEEIETSPRSTTFEAMLLLGDDAIYLENQTADSTRLSVGYAVLSAPGFVVIYDDNEGMPGAVVGNSELLKSGGEHLIVTLDKTLVDGEIYYAMLFHDDGDSRFRESADTQVVDSEDSVVLMTFLASDETEPEIEAVLP